MDTDQFLAAMVARSKEGQVQFVTSPMRAWIMLSTMQLALRHPEFPASVRPVAEGIARNMQLAIAPKGSPLWQLAEQGWDAAFDHQVLAGHR